MDIAFISLIVAGVVASLQLLNYVNNRSIAKETSTDKFAKAAELLSIGEEINDITSKLEDHTAKISALQSAAAVLISQMNQQIREVEKLSDKLDDWK